jgi:hypothetical protein
VPWSNAVTLEGESWESVRARVILISCCVTWTSGRFFVCRYLDQKWPLFYRASLVSVFAPEQFVNNICCEATIIIPRCEV